MKTSIDTRPGVKFLDEILTHTNLADLTNIKEERDFLVGRLSGVELSAVARLLNEALYRTHRTGHLPHLQHLQAIGEWRKQEMKP